MEVKYLSFGNITIRLALEEKLLETEKYTDFFCKEKAYDFSFVYKFSDESILPPKDVHLCENNGTVICSDGINIEVYYKSAIEGEYFAVRRYRKGSGKFLVTLTEKARGKFWMRLVLNTLGIENLAFQKNGIVFHSSFIETDGKAILFTGPCGIGKSTQANLWNENRKAEIINGDKTLIFLKDEKVFASGLPFSGSSGISENRCMELSSIVKLSKGKENTVRILSPSEAFFCLMKSVYFSVECGKIESDIPAKIAEKVSFFSLCCTPDERAVAALESFMKGREKL